MISIQHAFVLFLVACFGSVLPGLSAQAQDTKNIVFVSGKPSHGPMKHEHRAGNILLAKRLNSSGLPVKATVLPENGFPTDPAILKGADTIVAFCTGHHGHLLNPHLEEFDACMKQGTGLVMIHWATEAVRGAPGDKFLEWMGGFCDLNWSVNPHWAPEFKTFPDHPIARGLTPFSLNDEWYYHMRFVDGMKGVTPILSAVPGPETLKRPDGERSGNPQVRRAVANKEPQHVAWAYERPDGKGRGFGFTGGHNHTSWLDDNFRKVVLNAILWTAHVEVPKGGLKSATPSQEEINANLDDKKKKPPRKKPVAVAPPRAPAPVSFDALRKQQHRPMDVERSLNLILQALADADQPATQAALLEGMLKGLEGQRDVPAPKRWNAVGTSLRQSDDPAVVKLAQRLDQVFGNREALAKALTLIQNRKAPAPDRKSALHLMVTRRDPALRPILSSLLDDPVLQQEAIRAYGTLEDQRAPALLLGRYAKFPTPSKRAVIETLSSRQAYAAALFTALKQSRVPRADIPAYTTRALSKLLGEPFTQWMASSRPVSADKAAVIATYKKLLTPERLAKADSGRGRQVYRLSCVVCHKLYDEGGHIGPELTGSNRADLDYILLNMVDPSGDIPDAYKLVTLTLKNKQVLSGTLAGEDSQRVELNTIGQKLVVLKSDIAKREVADASMMPEGLLATMTEQQVLDLVKYLQSTQQIEVPE